MKIHQRAVTGKIVISGVNAKVGISNGRVRHVDRVKNLLEVRGRTVGADVVNGEDWMGEEKQNALHI